MTDELLLVSDDPHSASASTGGRLNDNGKSDLKCKPPGLIGRIDRIGASGKDWHARCLHRSAGLNLIAHHANYTWLWPYKLDVAVLADLCERLGFG